MAKRRRCKDKLPHVGHGWDNLSLNVVVHTMRQGMLSSRFWCPGIKKEKVVGVS